MSPSSSSTSTVRVVTKHLKGTTSHTRLCRCAPPHTGPPTYVVAIGDSAVEAITHDQHDVGVVQEHAAMDEGRTGLELREFIQRHGTQLNGNDHVSSAHFSM